jgi:hypothetical protein
MATAEDHSVPSAFFEQIFSSSDPFEFLSALVGSNPPTLETDWLDFKGNPQEKDTLKIWSEAVSGFANTGGGVLIWGIDARPVDGVDCASSLSLVPSPTSLRSKLQTNLHCTTNPPVQDVQIREIPGPTGAGFLVCFVPESPHKPHRAEQAKQQYFIRAGASFVVPSPPLLRQMFFPSTAPSFEVTIAPTWSVQGSKVHVRFQGRLRNTGSRTMHDVFVQVLPNRTGELKSGGYQWNQVDTLGGQNGFELKRPLHPGMVVPFFFFDATCEGVESISHQRVLTVRPNLTMLVRVSIYARDIDQQLLYAEFDEEDVVEQRMRIAVSGVPPLR